MTYDNWKTINPADAELGGSREWAQCDCCGKYRPLSHCWVYGIETFACDECRGYEHEDEEEVA